jgi:dCMP deaminase
MNDKTIEQRFIVQRKSWHDYFMDIAKLVATRSTCDRKHVGAVIVRDRVVLTTGYNGSISGTPHCNDDGHLMIDDHCVRTVHAEMNAIAQAAKNGIMIAGANLYVTARPCWNCFKVIANTGIEKIYYEEEYRPDENITENLKYTNIKLIKWSKE